MTEIPKCPTCGRRPSERYGVHVLLVRVDFSPAFRGNGCPDPIHDLADQGPALKAERDEARAMVMELFQHCCLVVDKNASVSRSVYDHMCSSTCEEAQSALIELRKEVAGLKRPLPPSGGLCMACAGPVDESGATTAHDVADQGPAEREDTARGRES